MQTAAYQTIPQPPAYPIIGHLTYMRPPHPIQNLMALAREYGPIFRLRLPEYNIVVLSSQELVNEACDEQRFHKNVGSSLRNLRPAVGDALFTAWTHEPNWQKAHNILLPNFSTKAMHGYLPAMVEMTDQLMRKWERLNLDDEVSLVDDMTRVTLDTIGLCGFNYRFNSFYREDSHPFVGSLLRVLTEALNQLGRLPGQTALMPGVRAQFQADIAFMNAMVDKLIEERRASGEHKQDLLGYMLEGVDKQTGEKLDDVNIRYQIITFLAAGHETTSGLLSFAVYFLLKNPHILARAHEEMDRLLGDDPNAMPTYAQVNHFDYIAQILKETLRLWPTAPAFGLFPEAPTTLAGKYKIEADDVLSISIPMLHRDRQVWGAEAEVFDPDHFTPEREAALPPNSFKPFGNGVRACIGRQFAMQEAILVLGKILHRFELEDFNHYDLEVKESLTLKPANFHIKVHPRRAHAVHVPGAAFEPAQAASSAVVPAPVAMTGHAHSLPLLVLFGSNMGTAEGVARQIGDAGRALNFDVTVAPLDDFIGKLPSQGALLIVSASYNGTPPDNAAKFCRWLRDQPDGVALAGVKYAVFGCGNRDWAGTYQAVPKLIDARLAALGARRLHARGEGDGHDDFDGQFRDWYTALWPAVAREFTLELADAHTSAGPLFTVEMVPERQVTSFAQAFDAQPMTILENRELQRGLDGAPSERSTRHIAIALLEGIHYQAGDYLGVIPRHSDELVRRVAARLGVSPEAFVRIHPTGSTQTHLPVDQPVRVSDLLAGYVELQEPATRTQIRAMLEHNECPPDREKLLELSGSDADSAARYREAVLTPRKSLVDLLDEFPATQLPLAALLELLPPLKPRYYSISSSPRVDAGQCSLTVAVLSGPARSGRGTFQGVCSSYLSRLPAGSQVQAFVSDPNSPFHLPADPATPIILIGPGTGLAPMRGFLQERAALQAAGAQLGPALLFFSCRHPRQDYIYEDDLTNWAARGVAHVVTAFSRLPDQPKRYVQDELRAHQADVWRLMEQGAIVYICGDARSMAPAVRQAFADIFRAQTATSPAVAEAWLDDLVASRRYLTDVWAAS